MKNNRYFRTALLVATLAVVLALMPTMMFAAARSGASAAASPRITQAIDEAQTLTLQGNTRPEANSLNDRGAVPDSLDLDHMFLLLQRSPEKERQLDKLIEQLNDKTSPNFHHWLTADEFGRRFGVAQSDIDTVTGWLQSHGFRVNQVYASRVLIDFSGTAGQIREAFHTGIHLLGVNGEQHISNMRDPQIPQALAPVVKGIASLNDFKPHPMYKVVPPDYTFAGCAPTASHPTLPGTCYEITPQDTATIYNVNPVYAAGFSGQGQTIALIEDTDTYSGSGDWTTYRNTFGLSTAFPLGTYTQVHPGCADPGTNADDGEAALDVEVATSIAPSAAIENVACASGTVTFGGLIALQNLINAAGPYPGIVSVSYGVCEAFNGNGGNQAFYNTYQQAASQGISVFVSSGDEGASSCSADFSAGSQYDLASLGVTGWGDSPYNVSVGGTDFEDVYNFKEGGAALSTYWNTTNTSGFGSAKSYIPEMPWNDSCADVLISQVAHSTFTTYGTTGTCNTSPFNASTGYLIAGAGSGGASNCATGAGGANTSGAGLSEPECQGWPKPSWQSGSSLTGGLAVYGQPSDGVRDIPDVSLFASNGLWGHYEVVCWSDPTQTSGGAASCSSAPSSWTGFGGTSVATPMMAAMQALVNQKTGQTWGNPNPTYYQIAQNEYGTAGGSFLGGSCNSSTGSGSGCVFNDITQGDIDTACEDNGSAELAHCYKPSGTHGVDSTDNITGATVLWGGSGYTVAPTCTIAGPTNNSPYKAPTGTTLWAGGTQATCTATVNSGTTNAIWTVLMASTSGVGDTIILTNVPLGGSTTCGPYTLSGASTTVMATNLGTAIGTGCSLASETVASSTVTLTAKTAGAAGNFIAEFGTATEFDAFYITITNTTKGQGPNYVSGITIGTAGTGYQPETPITLTGGGGTGAIAVANTTPATAAQSYQPAYGAAPGYDLATGLGSVNANNLVNSCAWGLSSAPGICSPVAGSTLTGYGTTFVWNAVPSATAYWLDIGSTQGGNNYYSSGSLPTSTLSAYITTLPNDGSTVWVRLYGFIGGSWQANDYSYTAFGSSNRGVITTPTPGSSFTGSSATFSWTAGSGATAYWLDIGSSAGANNYYTSGNLGNVLTKAVSGLPTNGSTIYVTLYSYVNGGWLGNGYTYTAFNASSAAGVLTTPTPGSTLTGSSITFAWTAGSGATAYWMDIGATAGGNNYYSSGNLGNVLSTIVNGLPTDGSTIYVTLYSLIAGSWTPNAYTYTALNAGSGLAVMQTPIPGSMFTANSVTFTWSAGTGATAYWLDIGTTPGANNAYSSGNLGNVLTTTANILPTGLTLYATLYSYIGGQWLSNTYTYTAAPGAVMQTPVPGSTLSGSSATFTWSAGGGTPYILTVGTTYGGSDLYSSGSIGTLSATATGLPADGSTVYVTVATMYGANWLYNYYYYVSGP